MKVLIVTQYPIPHGGGMSAHVGDLIESFQTDGIDFRMIEGKSIARSMLCRLYSRLKYAGRYDLYLVRVLDRAVERLKQVIAGALGEDCFDLIHCHDPVASYAAQQALATRGLKIPVIQTVHGPMTYEFKMGKPGISKHSDIIKKFWDIERESYRQAARIIAVDTGQKRIVTDDFKISSDKVIVIFNCVSCKSIASVLNVQSSINVSRPYLLVPRRLVEKTGVHIAIQSLAKLDKYPELKMVIAGHGMLRARLEKLAKTLNVSSRILFLNSIPRDEVLRLAKDALAVLIPSVPSSGVVEATSIAALEAMACSTVVIASRIGGLAEIIKDRHTGFLVPHSNPDALADVVSKLRENADLHRDVCQRGFEYVRKNLDRPIWFSKVRKVYESILEPK
jgi:glycosyltransferase involved in cell wall biosynthesis